MELKKIDSVHWIDELCRNISDDDLIEFDYFKKIIIKEDVSIKDHIMKIYNDSTNELYIITHNNELISLGGCDDDGCVFFLTTKLSENLNQREKIKFIKLIKQHRDFCLKKHSYIWNFIYEENHHHKKLLTLIGAEIHEDVHNFQYFNLFTIKGG